MLHLKIDIYASIIIIMVTVATIITPIWLKIAYKREIGKEKESINV
jgi:hypothetical protein